MTRRMLPESIWLDIYAIFDATDGDGAALLRVVRASLPTVALGFVNGGVA
jgi:hypothetical protein